MSRNSLPALGTVVVLSGFVVLNVAAVAAAWWIATVDRAEDGYALPATPSTTNHTPPPAKPSSTNRVLPAAKPSAIARGLPSAARLRALFVPAAAPADARRSEHQTPRPERPGLSVPDAAPQGRERSMAGPFEMGPQAP